MASKGTSQTRNGITSNNNMSDENWEEIAEYALDEYYEANPNLNLEKTEVVYYRELSDEEAIEDLQNQFIMHAEETEETLTQLWEQIKGLGYKYTGIQKSEWGEESLSFKLGNQELELSRDIFSSLQKGELNMTTMEVFQHFKEGVPELLKYPGGKVQLDWEGGNFYSPNEKVVHLDRGSFLPENTNSATNFKNVLEHELTHRLDYLGKDDPVISEHPYFKVLSQAFPSTSYSNGYKIQGDDSYGTENLAEALAPQGSVRTPLTNYQKNVLGNRDSYSSTTQRDPRRENSQWVQYQGSNYLMSKDIPYRDYQMVNPINADLGYVIHGLKTPKQVFNYLDSEFKEYLRNNT